MATTNHRVTTPSTANATSYASGAFTPAAGDLMLVGVMAGATAATGSVSNSQSITFTKVGEALVAGSTDRVYVFIADSQATAVSQTVTFDCTGDAADGAVIVVATIGGITRTGISAVRQFKVVDNQAAAGTPAVTFDAAVLTTNPTFGYVGNASNPANVTAPVGHTTFANSGYSTPTTGLAYCTRLTGFTGPTLTWNSTSATAFGVIAVEIDTSSPSVTGTATVVLPALAATADGAVDVEGTTTVVLPALTVSLSGAVSVPVEGTAGVVLPTLAATAAGSVDVEGTATAVLPAFGATAAGDVDVTGTSTAVLPALAASLSGLVGVSGVAGSLDATLPALSASLAGELDVTGTVVALLPALGSEAAGTLSVGGTADVVLPALAAALAGSVVDTSGFRDITITAALVTGAVAAVSAPTATGTLAAPRWSAVLEED